MLEEGWSGFLAPPTPHPLVSGWVVRKNSGVINDGHKVAKYYARGVEAG